MTAHPRYRVVLLAGLLAALPLSSAIAQAYSEPFLVDFKSVMDFPTDPVAPADMFLEIWLESDYSYISLYEDTTVVVTGSNIYVDIFAETGEMAAPDTFFMDVLLGTFGEGTYNYTVIQNGPTSSPPWEGEFTVVPEPATLSLLALGGLLLTRRRR